MNYKTLQCIFKYMSYPMDVVPKPQKQKLYLPRVKCGYIFCLVSKCLSHWQVNVCTQTVIKNYAEIIYHLQGYGIGTGSGTFSCTQKTCFVQQSAWLPTYLLHGATCKLKSFYWNGYKGCLKWESYFFPSFVELHKYTLSLLSCFSLHYL